MSRRHKAAGKSVRAPRRKTLTRRNSSAAGQGTEVARLARELEEAREE